MELIKIYIYNVNNKNEFLNEIEVPNIKGWENVSTTVKPAECEEIGKSYAFNPKSNAWDILIDDWRGVTFYYKQNSKITKPGKLEKLSDEFTFIAPPDFENEYIFEDNDWVLKVSQEEMIAAQLKEYENAIQNHIDEVAQSRGYDNGYTCASYYDDKNERYANDAKAFKDWRSDVWVYVNELLNSWKAGNLQEIPTIQEVINNLPVIEWINE